MKPKFEFTQADFDEVLRLSKTDKDFYNIQYTKDGMVIVSGKTIGWFTMNAKEFDEMMDSAIKKYLSHENQD